MRDEADKSKKRKTDKYETRSGHRKQNMNNGINGLVCRITDNTL